MTLRLPQPHVITMTLRLHHTFFSTMTLRLPQSHVITMTLRLPHIVIRQYHASVQ